MQNSPEISGIGVVENKIQNATVFQITHPKTPSNKNPKIHARLKMN